MTAGTAVVIALAAPAAGSEDASTSPVDHAASVAHHVDEPLAVHDYLLSCGGCHKLDGRGSVHVPPLRGVDRLLAHAGGRAYVLRVPGVTQAPLSDARLAALLNWVFAEFGSGVPTPRFSAAEVAAGRAEAFVDPRAARAALR
jgi:mono/diheme cytochrome c family protein